MVEEIVKQLKELNATTKRLLEAQGLQFAFDPLRYIAWKLRSGEAYAFQISYYQLIAAGGTFTGVFINPEGYVQIAIREGIVVSQNGVFELTRIVDNRPLPDIYVPRLCSGEFNWAETFPFGYVKRDSTAIIYTNHDLVPQWLVGGIYGIFLRKDVWERDSKLIDMAAEKFAYPLAPLPTPP